MYFSQSEIAFWATSRVLPSRNDPNLIPFFPHEALGVPVIFGCDINRAVRHF